MDWYGMSCARPCALLRSPTFLMPLYHALKILSPPKMWLKGRGFYKSPNMSNWNVFLDLSKTPYNTTKSCMTCPHPSPSTRMCSGQCGLSRFAILYVLQVTAEVVMNIWWSKFQIFHDTKTIKWNPAINWPSFGLIQKRQRLYFWNLSWGWGEQLSGSGLVGLHQLVQGLLEKAMALWISDSNIRILLIIT